MQELDVKQNRSISLSDSSSSDTSVDRRNTADSVGSIEITHNNFYIYQYKNYFLIAASLVMVGGFYNCLFQGFIKDQFIETMEFTNNQYTILVTAPHFPNIFLPILFGPLADSVGIRKGTFICSSLMLLGMICIIFSIIPKSFALMLIGKFLHQIGTENTHLCQSTIVSKWFKFSNLALALALCSFVVKLSSSLSGIGYPYLFDQNHELALPLSIGLICCILSFIAAITIIYMDRKSEAYDVPLNAQLDINKQKKFSLSDIKEFDGLFWLISLQVFIIWGAFYSFQNYGQTILIHKFGFNEIEASIALSALFIAGMTSPFFGHFSHKYGNRAHVMIGISSLCLFSFFLVLIAPGSQYDKPVAYVFLVLFGIAISIGNAYIFPSIPLISDANYIGTAFGICYASKNAGTFAFSLIGGYALGDKDNHYNNFLLFLFCVMIIQLGISLFTLYYDKKRKNILEHPRQITNKKELDTSALSQQLV